LRILKEQRKIFSVCNAGKGSFWVLPDAAFQDLFCMLP
jgi:hypothetical protein